MACIKKFNLVKLKLKVCEPYLENQHKKYAVMLKFGFNVRKTDRLHKQDQAETGKECTFLHNQVKALNV